MTNELKQLNFRSLAGLPANKGEIRDRLLYRSEGPRNFDNDQLDELRQLDIKTIVDLRSAEERSQMPHAWQQSDCQWLELNVDADLRVFGAEGRERLTQGKEASHAINIMTETYRSIPQALAPHWEPIASSIVNDKGPMLINCTAGKDRTGVAVALLLEMAGVPRDAILDDYMQSGIFGKNMAKAGTLENGFRTSYGFLPSQGQIDALIGVRPDYLEAAWDEITSEWQGTQGYFEAAGLSEQTQQAVRARLTD